ncbi:uncharacterized protein LOC109719332 [Ananas comosus]|uniref:Uncharacterized protein LOC109719332 n=1 Tax=Ananas comosus TaxID=4615 RepID=A0A6P5FYR6_ANACO|nr:uncharacterized protein LOC109719332 [Ananas comosus]
MNIIFVPAAIRAALLHPRPLLLHAAAWTALLTTSVAVASFAPEAAFVWAVSPASAFSRGGGGARVRVPTEGPALEVVCVPARLFGRSRLDALMPPLFAALVVGASAFFVRAMGLWEYEESVFE